ncbi:hypothetical protein PENTCL1PPCAC_19671, partial [Pristionchus entomophagus]
SKKLERAKELCGNDQGERIKRSEKCGQDCACVGGSKQCKCNPNNSARVECSEDCECTVESCSNRLLQRGRQTPILIIRHPEMGWTCRALEDLPK